MKSPFRACVFVGPSLSGPDVHAALGVAAPQVRVLPPVGRGDILALLHDPPEIIGIIDGYFFQRPSVQHKEILLAMERGIQVLGAASMGALRAAELDRFGMVGLGEVYRMYARGRIDGDDEVALVHGSADDDYRALTLPLVNVRIALRKARQTGVISMRAEKAILEAGKKIDFTQRRYGAMLRDARAAFPEEIAAFERFLREHPCDAKRDDALQLVHELAHKLRDKPMARPKVRMTTSPTVFLALGLRERKLALAGDDVLTEALVSSLEKLQSSDMPSIMRRLVQRMMLADEARSRGLRVPLRATLVRRWRKQKGLAQSAHYKSWLAARGLEEKDVAIWLEQRYLAMAVLRSTAGDRISERVKALVVAAAARLGDSSAYPNAMLVCSPGVPWENMIVREWKMLGRWPAAVARAREVVAIRDEVERKTSGLVSALSTQRLERWFAQRWNVNEADVRRAALGRGFTSYREFIDTARVAYMAERQWAHGAAPSKQG